MPAYYAALRLQPAHCNPNPENWQTGSHESCLENIYAYTKFYARQFICHTLIGLHSVTDEQPDGRRDRRLNDRPS